jgi:hypothetical protein
VKSIRGFYPITLKSFHVSYSLFDNLNTTQDLLRLMGKFLIHENVPARGACNVVDNPREGEVIQPFKKGSFNKNCIPGPSSSGSNKRPRLEASPSETGV